MIIPIDTMQFNEEQKKAVEHTQGPMLVLAGPGSGKTAVIAGRLCRLIQKGVSPSSILVVTFTRAAAAEMKERFLRQSGTSSTLVTFGTFHGVFYGILRHTWHISGQNIISEEQKNQLLQELVTHSYKDAEGESDLPRSVSKEISTVKSGGLELEHFYSAVLPQEVFRRIYQEYQAWMKENRKLDFDDIMVWCRRLFDQRPDVLRLWQKKFQYILIDEFQDISPLQYHIVKQLALPENNLFIVGDDDQSIYRFRGANPGIMLNFPKDYPNAKRAALEMNYRSTPEILTCAGRLIAGNQRRFAKKIQASHQGGAPVELQIFDHVREETLELAKSIRKKAEEGLPYEKMAVLARTNMGCRAAAEQLMAWQIPFYAGDIIPCIYDHWIAKNILAYLRIGAGSRKRADFLQIYNRPNRYFTREAFDEAQISFEHLYQYYEEKEWMCQRVEQLEQDLQVLGQLAPYGAIQYVRRGIGYESYVREYAQSRNLPPDELLQVLDELADGARGFSNLEAWEKHITQYREELQKQNQRDRKKAKEGVMISTLHASKGMEYAQVYILDVNEGVIPYHKAILEADLEEERRMLYVGMTRAEKELHLYAVRERYEKKMELSRFLAEIFPNRRIK